MISDEKQTLLRVVERYARTGDTNDDQVKVTCLPDNQTSWVEQTAVDTRTIMLNEYRVDGKVIWAGYSGRAGVVYLSLVKW